MLPNQHPRKFVGNMREKTHLNTCTISTCIYYVVVRAANLHEKKNSKEEPNDNLVTNPAILNNLKQCTDNT